MVSLIGGLKHFVAEAVNAMAMFDREMRFLAASPQWLASLGLTLTPQGRCLYEVYPGISDDWKAVHRRCLAGATESRERERFNGDGAAAWVKWEARPWRDDDGAIGGIIVAAEDITARVEAKERAEELARRLEDSARCAQAAEQRLKDAIDALPAGFDLYDANDRLVVSNAAASAMYPHTADARCPGTSFEELLRIGVEQRTHGPSAADNERWLRERMERHRDPRGPTDQLTVDGRWLRIEERRIPDGGVVVIRSDVTDIKARERELAEKTALLEATLHNMGEGIGLYRPDRTLLVGNGLAARLLDVPAALTRPGVSFDEIARYRAARGDFGEVDVDAFVKDAADQFAARTPLRRTRRLPDGRSVETRLNPLPDGGGVFMIRDVTELADREAKLLQKTALLEATLQNMGEGIIAFDADRRLLVANDVALRLLDAPPHLTQPGASFDDITRFRAERGDHGDVDVQTVVTARGAVVCGERKPARLTRRLPNGSTIDTRFNPTADGGVVIVFRDVTERADNEAKLAEALVKAEQASQAKSEFLAMISHELRTPMNAIVGMSSLLREHNLSLTERSYVSAIEAAGESLLLIINDLVEFASLDAGGGPPLRLAPLDVRGLIEGALGAARMLPHGPGLSFHMDVDAGVPAALRSDGGRIHRILLSLLDNAVKHTAKGTITVRARANPGSRAETLSLRFEVEDTGSGFPPSEAARLFLAFERGASPDRTRAAGLGLGLAICRKHVDLMGGSIGADSEPGAGSRFWFEIPVCVVPSQARQAIAPRRSNGRRVLKVLVAEDIETNRAVMRAMLEKLGHEAHFAEDGAQAIEAVARHDYDAILMDIQMPNIDGLEATRTIRRSGGRLEGVPIIAVSAFSQPAHQDAAMSAGATGFLTKPVRRSALDDALRSLPLAQPIEG